MTRQKSTCLFLIIVFLLSFASYPEAEAAGNLEICTKNGSQLNPAAAWDPNRHEYLAVWYDQQDPGIYGVRLDPNGVLLNGSLSDPSQIASIRGNDTYSPSIACNPKKNQYLVVWQDQDPANTAFRNTYAALVSVDKHGNLIKKAIPGIHRVKERPWRSRVAWNGEQFLIVWYDYRGNPPEGLADADIYGTRIDPNGSVLDPDSFEICTAASAQVDPVVTGYQKSGGSGERGWLVAWEDGRDPSSGKDIYASLIKQNNDGTVSRGDSFPIIRADKDQKSLSVAVGPDSFFLVWLDKRFKDTKDNNGNTIGNFLLGARVSFDGQVLLNSYGNGVEVLVTAFEPSDGMTPEPLASAAYVQNNYLVAWDCRDKVYGTRISLQGDILDIAVQNGMPIPRPLTLSDPNKTSTFPFVAADYSGGKALITWMAGEKSSPEKKDIAGIIYSLPEPPNLDWAGTDNYENTGVYPSQGEGGTEFTFKVKYTTADGENDVPLDGRLSIDLNHNGVYEGNEIWVMERESANSNIYQKKVSILYDGDPQDPDTGTVTYRFYFRDEYNTAEGDPALDHTLKITPHGHVPQLSWLGAANYVQDGVDPDSGGDGTDFTFKVKYQDSDNIAPQIHKVWIDLNGDTTFLDSEKFELEKGEGSDYKTGVTYSYKKSIRLNRAGLVAYRFYFDDTCNVAQGEPKEINYLAITNTSEICIHGGLKQQVSPDIASTSSKSLVVWEDWRDAEYIDQKNSDIYRWSKIYGRFLESGSPMRIDKNNGEIKVGADNPNGIKNTQRKPRVAGQGNIYLVVWEDLRAGAVDASYMNTDIYGQILDPRDPDKLIEIPVDTYQTSDPNAINQENPAVAAGKDNKFLVVWDDALDCAKTGKNIHGAIVAYNSSTSTASVTPPPGFEGVNRNYIIHDQSGKKINQTKPAVAWGGQNYLVVWQDYRPELADGDVNSHLYANQVDPNGRVMKSIYLTKDQAIGNGVPVVIDPNATQSSPAIAADPNTNNFLVVCEYEKKRNNFSGKDIYGVLVRRDGTTLKQSFPICTAYGDQTRPRVSWDRISKSYLVVWASQPEYKTLSGSLYGYDTDIRAARVDANGNLIGSVASGTGWEICVTQGVQSTPAVSSNEYLNQVVWADNRSFPYSLSYGSDIYGAPFKSLLNWVEDEDSPYGVNPVIGGNGKDYYFEINYLDIAQKNPKVSQVWIDIDGDGEYSADERHSMTPADPSDSNLADGKTYSASIQLTLPETYQGNGAIDYRFYFEDEGSSSIMGSANLPHSLQINPPLLYWTVESNYQSGGVYPASGDTDTTFEFRVIYVYQALDDSVRGPDVAKLWIDDKQYDLSEMDPNDENYSDGKGYFYSLTNGKAGTHDYRFYFEDESGGVAFGEPARDHQFTITKESGPTWTTYMRGAYITSMAVVGETLWVGTRDNGLSIFDGSDWFSITPDNEPSLLSPFITSLVFDSTSNVIYVGTAQGLISYDGSKWKNYDQQVTKEVLGKNNPIGSMAFDKKHYALWIVSLPSSQSAYSNSNAALSDSNTTMSDPNAALIQYDISGNNWIAYTRANTSSQEGGGLPSDKIQSMGVDSNGDIWVSTFIYSGTEQDVKTEYKGLSRFNVDQDKWTQYTTVSNNADNVLKTNCINRMGGDDHGSLWFGGVSTSKDDTEGIEGGLYRFDIENNKWTDHFYKGKSGVQLGSNVITALAVDGSALWVGAAGKTDGTNGGVSLYNGSSWEPLFTTADGLVNNSVTAIAVQDNGDVWFGTPTGLSRYGSGPGDAAKPSFHEEDRFAYPSGSGCFIDSLGNPQNSPSPWSGWTLLMISLVSIVVFAIVKEISMGKKVVAVVLFFLLLTIPIKAGAESIRKGVSLELRSGFYCPSDNDKWNTAFGRDFSAFGGLKIGREILPNIELGLSADYVHAYKREWSVYYVPVGLSLIYAMRYSQDQFFVPYLGAGADFLYGKTGHIKEGDHKPTYLKEPGYHAIAGVRLLLDALAAEDADAFDQKYGVNNSYLVFEARYLKLFNADYADRKFDSDEPGTGYLDPKGLFISIGILLEF